jgi:hypothetical protein
MSESTDWEHTSVSGELSTQGLVNSMYAFATTNGLEAEAERIRNMPVHQWVRDRHEQVRKAHLLDLFESRDLLNRFISECWPAGSSDEAQRKRQRWNAKRARNARLLGPPSGVVGDEEDVAEEAEEQCFALEAGLRDFIAHNLGVVEPGLTPYPDRKRCVEFSIDDGRGRIDVLALDAHGTPVVIELKLWRGRNQTIGQLLYYMGWIDQSLGKGPSRGIIVAKDISDDLVLAVQRVQGVMLFRYKVALTLETVAVPGRS